MISTGGAHKENNFPCAPMFILGAFIALFCCFFPAEAFAQDALEQAGQAICEIASVFGSDVARALASFGIVTMGAYAFLGKLQWPTVLLTGLGVMLMFSVPQIIGAMIINNSMDASSISECLNYRGAAGSVWADMGDLVCQMAGVYESDIARAIASFGIVFMGATAFSGKMSYVNVLVTALGVFILFGVGYIASDAVENDEALDVGCKGVSGIQASRGSGGSGGGGANPNAPSSVINTGP